MFVFGTEEHVWDSCQIEGIMYAINEYSYMVIVDNGWS